MQEWYLLNKNTRPNETSGFENDAFLDNYEDAFDEALETNIATNVIVYNSTLTWSKNVRCIIQDNVANTQLNSMARCALFQVGTTKAGMLVFFENRYWLITGYPGNNTIYEKVTLSLCQWKIKWQNRIGNIIERWVNISTASKYEMGENKNYIMTFPTNNYIMMVGYDSETINLDGVRFFMDRNIQNPQKIYKVTRDDDPIYNYGDEHGCVLNFILDRDEFNKETDNKELMICDYDSYLKEPSKPIITPSQKLNISIIGNDELAVGFEQTYILVFTNDNGDEVDKPSDFDFEWNVESNYGYSIIQSINPKNKQEITLLCRDEEIVNSTLMLEVIENNNNNNGNNTKEIIIQLEIKIVDTF